MIEALGAQPPRYGHVPLLHGPDGKKLSKRHGAASVQELREAGYLPAAVRNYVALLGWGSGDDETMLSTEELVEHFDIARVQRNPAQFDEQQAALAQRPLHAELAPGGADRRARGASTGATGSARRPRSAPRSSRRSPTSGRCAASSTTARRMTRRRASAGWVRRGAPCSPRCATCSRPSSRSTCRTSRRRSVALVEQRGGKPAGHLPAAARRASRPRGVSGDLRDRGGARERGDAQAHGTRPQLLIDALPIERSAQFLGGKCRYCGRAACGPPHAESMITDDEIQALHGRQPDRSRSEPPHRHASALEAPARPERGHGRRLTRRLRGARGVPGARRVAQPPAGAGRRPSTSAGRGRRDVVESDIALVVAVMRVANAGASPRRPRPRRDRRRRDAPAHAARRCSSSPSASAPSTSSSARAIWDAAPERFRLHGLATRAAAACLAAEIGYETATA